ncbi:hypothetical protein RND81_09G037700 [Saponaria officinalis]|uniref:Transmembrane protein n=1 Tax=Saponaria officinalis TaxID=3572 RepID=A0AAW1IHJ9_SAPOF
MARWSASGCEYEVVVGVGFQVSGFKGWLALGMKMWSTSSMKWLSTSGLWDGKGVERRSGGGYEGWGYRHRLCRMKLAGIGAVYGGQVVMVVVGVGLTKFWAVLLCCFDFSFFFFKY